MKRRGVTLIELLVALVILGAVVGMAMTIFRSQHQNWKTGSDKIEVGIMAKGALDEIGSAIRMTGQVLPRGKAGIQLAVSPAVGASFVLNRARWVDTTAGFVYDPAGKILRIAVDSAGKFSDQGYALLSITTPPQGVNGLPAQAAYYTLPIAARVVHSGGCASDSLVLDATQLASLPNGWLSAGNIDVAASTLVYNVDTVSYAKSGDTLYVRMNRGVATPYAIGIDSLKLQYHHPSAGWSDGLSSAAPANAVDLVRIRVVSRSLRRSGWLLSKIPSSRGYQFVRLETEVGLRNDSLVNK